MHILITGAAGMVGRKLTQRLVANGSVPGLGTDHPKAADICAAQLTRCGIYQHRLIRRYGTGRGDSSHKCRRMNCRVANTNRV